MNVTEQHLVDIARAYCELIERAEHPDEDWLASLSTMLPKLHAAMAEFARMNPDATGTLAPDLEARFELFTRLRTLLGERDSYWMEYDSANDDQPMSGSLADDLTDIYCELKYGLMLLQDEPDREADAYASWQEGYRVHWGQHLIDAERHLYDLESRNKLSLQ